MRTKPVLHFVVSALMFLTSASAMFLSFNCSKPLSDQQKVDAFLDSLSRGNARTALRGFQNLKAELRDSAQLARALMTVRRYQEKFEEVDSLLALTDSLSNWGFNVPAVQFAKRAEAILPNDSLVQSRIRSIPDNKRPKYEISGFYGAVKFDYVFHTRWTATGLLPDTVNVTITNTSPTYPTALAFFVPTIYYLEVNGTGGHGFCVVPDPQRWAYSAPFKTPVFCNQTRTGNIVFHMSDVKLKLNTKVTFQYVFMKIVVGGDPRFFVEIIDKTNAHLNGLKFIGYE